MATTVNIDDDSAEELLRLTGATTKNEAVRKAVAEFIRTKRKHQLLALRGKWEQLASGWQEPLDASGSELVQGDVDEDELLDDDDALDDELDDELGDDELEDDEEFEDDEEEDDE